MIYDLIDVFEDLFFGGGGIFGFIPWLIAIIIAISIVKRVRSGSVFSMALKKFSLNEGADEFLRIEGRRPGLISWVLSLMGISPVRTLVCNGQAIKFETVAERFGKKTQTIPRNAITEVQSGIDKPFLNLIFAGISVLVGIIFALTIARYSGSTAALTFFVGLVVGGIFVAFYFLKRTVEFSILIGSRKMTIRVKRSIIEGQSVSPEQYEAVAAALTAAILESRGLVPAVKQYAS